MRHTDAIIIGGGQAGLAVSHCLAARGVDHVVLERDRLAEKWRSARWDSLRLLTPNWMSRLPGQRYSGDDPDGFMAMPEVVGYLERYAAGFSAPVHEDTTVQAVSRDGGHYKVVTTRGIWSAPTVVIATGECDVPRVPAIADGLSPAIRQVVPARYRNPGQLPEGGVLIVGASATGVQLAEKIHASGRPVTLAAGHHIRLPRSYRGRDIMWWLDRLGTLDQPIDRVPNPEQARRQPSLQLSGRRDRTWIDLAELSRGGVRITGRLTGISGTCAGFADDLADTVGWADRKLTRLIDRIDAYADANAGKGFGEAEPVAPGFFGPGPTALDLRAERIRTVIWATGFRRHYSWLNVPVLDSGGEIRHAGGITPSEGLYVIGLRFLRRRKSSFIDGVGQDAVEIGRSLHAYLKGGRNALAA